MTNELKRNAKGGCWACKHMKALDPETDYCKLLDRKMEDVLDLMDCRLKDCPLSDVGGEA